MRSSIFVALAVVAACQETTTDNFINPPPGVPATCSAIAELPGCDQGSISYSCTSDRPDDVGSDAGKGDTAQLVCSDGSPGAGSAMLYCCIPISQYYTECAPDPTIAGCVDSSVGFSCQGNVAPTDADPTIACSAGQPGSNGMVQYCCNTTALPATCAPTGAASTCASSAVGYTCAGSASPLDGGAPFTCAKAGGQLLLREFDRRLHVHAGSSDVYRGDSLSAGHRASTRWCVAATGRAISCPVK